MIRSLAVAALLVFAATSSVSCNGADLVVDDNRTDTDVTDDDGDDVSSDADNGPHVLGPPTLSIEVYNVTSTTVQLGWTHEEPAGCCTFRVYYGLASNGPFTAYGEVAAPPRIEGLLPDTLYYFYVTAVQSGVESAPSVVRPTLTKAGVAANFRVAQVGGGGVVLAWDAYAGASGFNIYRSEPGATEVTDASPVMRADGYATSAIIDGLASATSYNFKMSVEKGAFRFGDLSGAIGGTTTEPMAVTGFTPDYGFDDQTVTITGERFGTVVADVSVIFEGESGPGDERSSPATAVTDTTVTSKVPVGAASGPISVRRVLYSKATSSAAYDVGDMLGFVKVATGPIATAPSITSLHAATATHVLAGRVDGALLRSTNGGSFNELAYVSALTDATDCADAPGDTSNGIILTGIQCAGDDCLVARGDTCNAIRTSATFGGAPVVSRKRIGPATGPAVGPTRFLACGNPTDAKGCLSVAQNGTTPVVAYTTDFTTTDFSDAASTFPSGSDFGFRSIRGRPESTDVVIFGDGTGAAPRSQGLLLGSRPFGAFALFTSGPGDARGGDCTASDGVSYCVAALGARGVAQGSAATSVGIAFASADGLVAGASFSDAACLTHEKCVAVGVIDESLVSEKGVVAQTNDGTRWYYRFVGTLGLRVITCVPDTCFVGDRGGNIFRGN